MIATTFSIIVPVLNGHTYLHQCIESILCQTEKFELIVIDGGSTDGTLDIIHEYRNEILYWESGKDTGIANAFNRGLVQANGEIISILNSDDYLEPNALTLVAEKATISPKSGVFTGYCRILPTNKSSYIKKPNISAMKRYMSIYHPSTFIRKTTYEYIGTYNEKYRLAMDSEWIHRAMRNNVDFFFIDEILSNMRLGGISDINSTDSLKEYRQSAIEHNISSFMHATLFYWLHISSKMMDKNLATRIFKEHINKLFNKTTAYEK